MDEGEALIRSIWQRWNAGERFPQAEEVDPGIEIHSALTTHVFSGAAGLAAWSSEIDEQFVSWELGIHELRRLGPDSYILHGAISARGRTSGLDVDEPASWLVGLREGRIALIRNFIGADAHDAAEVAAP